MKLSMYKLCAYVFFLFFNHLLIFSQSTNTSLQLFVYLREEESNSIISMMGLDPNFFQIDIINDGNNSDTILSVKPDTIDFSYKNYFTHSFSYEQNRHIKSIPYRVDISYKVLRNFSLSEFIFEKGLNIWNCKIHGAFKINNVNIREGFELSESTIYDDVYIYNSIFERCLFVSDTFIKDLSFYNDVVDENFDLQNIEFFSPVWFKGVKFYNSSFIFSKFSQLAMFEETNFLGKTYFLRSSFKNSIILKNCFFEKEMDMLSLYNDGTHKYFIDVSGSNTNMLKLDFRECELFFRDYNMSFDQKNSIYQNLLSIQKSMNMPESYKYLDFDYNYFYHIESKKERFFFIRAYHYFINWIKKIWWEYGHTKELIIRNTMFLLFLFTLLNLFWIRYLNENVYKIDNIEITLPNKNSSILSNLWPALIYSSIIFLGVKMNIEKFKFNNKWAVMYLFFFYTIGLICLGYILNYILSVT